MPLKIYIFAIIAIIYDKQILFLIKNPIHNQYKFNYQIFSVIHQYIIIF